MYTDKPQPTKGYITFWILFVLSAFLVLGLLVLIGYFNGANTSSVIIEIIGLALPFMFVCIFTIVALYAAYHTEYVIQENVIEIKIANLVKQNIYRSDIRTVQKVQWTLRVLGFGIHNLGACNRFKDVLIILTDRQSVYISPSNPDAFLAVLSNLRE